jgi:hypothetical protein
MKHQYAGSSVVRRDTAEYLREVAITSVLELDRARQGLPEDFASYRELRSLFETHQLRPEEALTTCGHFPYLALARALESTVEKPLRTFGELALEMRLLRAEMRESPLLGREARASLMAFLLRFDDELAADIAPHKRYAG